MFQIYTSDDKQDCMNLKCIGDFLTELRIQVRGTI